MNLIIIPPIFIGFFITLTNGKHWQPIVAGKLHNGIFTLDEIAVLNHIPIIKIPWKHIYPHYHCSIIEIVGAIRKDILRKNIVHKFVEIDCVKLFAVPNFVDHFEIRVIWSGGIGKIIFDGFLRKSEQNGG